MAWVKKGNKLKFEAQAHLAKVSYYGRKYEFRRIYLYDLENALI